MTDQNPLGAKQAECRVLAADRGIGQNPNETRSLHGDHLDIEFVRLGRGERVVRAGYAGAGEEVAIVLEGTLRVESDSESHELGVGEGIIIPPNQGSCWQAGEDSGGLLYRVIVRAGSVR